MAVAEWARGKVSFDYVIVGGGTAGSVLAARLSEDPDARVLLLEAGSAVPIEAMSDPLGWVKLIGTKVDWGFSTTAQSHLNGDSMVYPRGKVLGGSSGINGMYHLRGGRADYDAWAAAGAEGWDYASLLPFFRRSETAKGRDPAYRGVDGPMLVAVPEGRDRLWEACYEGAVEAGFAENPDGNAASPYGVTWNEMNVVDGVRRSVSDNYLRPLSRENLTVITDALVRRLIIQGDRCVGVEYGLGGSAVETVGADQEVVLAAGAIGSPQLLQLSGVGPAQHLRDLGVEVKADLPGVGANLHDHLMSEVRYRTPESVSARFSRKPRVLVGGVQIMFVDVVMHPRWQAGPENGFSIVSTLEYSESRGSVRLASQDPRAAPLIDPNYLSDERDVATMLEGLRVAREIGATAALRGFGGKELIVEDDEAYLRQIASTQYHPAGTCRIGVDDNAVLDPRLRVHGLTGLRVADASVMPSSVCANLNATVLAIGERAASLIRGESNQAN